MDVQTLIRVFVLRARRPPWVRLIRFARPIPGRVR